MQRVLGYQVRFEAGSQLIAHFDQDLEAADLRKNVKALLMRAMTTLFGVRVEVARGCSTIVYISFITFKEASQAGVKKLLGELALQGAVLMRCPGFEEQSGVLNLQVEGLSSMSPSDSIHLR